MKRQAFLAAFVVIFGVLGSAYAQTQPKAAAQDGTGFTSYAEFGGTSNSEGQIYELTTSVGYETGTYTDPYTGQRRRAGGVTTSAGVGVGVGVGGSGSQSGSTEADRKAMEIELKEKGLPEGKASAPVAGHLYFPISNKKNAKYQLEYMLNGEKVTLLLP